MKSFPRLGAWFAAGGVLLTLTACERPPHDVTQIGYRGVGMEQLVNKRDKVEIAAKNVFPASLLPPAEAGGPKAAEVYKNVKVLTDLNIGQFTRLMLNITEWVAPKEGCNYCHTPNNLADESLYTKQVSRRMLEMTRHLNGDWTSHVKQTGVTCYTCHRGQPLPAEAWYNDPGNAPHAKNAGIRNGQNMPSAWNADSSLPNGGDLLNTGGKIRVVRQAALPQKEIVSTMAETETTYGLMMHFSESLGVNCTYCHNSRAFGNWAESTPQRTSAWHGIQMVKDLNTKYVGPLASVVPPNRLGPMGDIAKVGCATCHQGVNKPLQGAPMLTNNPELVASK